MFSSTPHPGPDPKAGTTQERPQGQRRLRFSFRCNCQRAGPSRLPDNRQNANRRNAKPARSIKPGNLRQLLRRVWLKQQVNPAADVRLIGPSQPQCQRPVVKTSPIVTTPVDVTDVTICNTLCGRQILNACCAGDPYGLSRSGRFSTLTPVMCAAFFRGFQP